MPSPVWKGSTAIHLQPGYPDYKVNASGEIVVLVYGGPYKALLAAKPYSGQLVTGFPYIPVSEVNVKPLGAGITGPGTLTITLQQDSSSTSSALLDQTDEIDWTELTKPIEKAPCFNAGGTYELYHDDLDDIEQWKNAATKALRKQIYEILSLNAQKFVDKIRAGEESFFVPAPLARRTTRSFNLTSGTTLGKIIVGKPFPECPNGYIWLTTADRSLRQAPRGKWERVQEWTGAQKWDTDLYSAVT